MPRSRFPSLVLTALLLLATATRGHCAPSEPAAWRGDVRFLLAAIDSIHPRPYKFFKRAQWDSAAADLEAKLPSLRPDQAIAGFSRILGMLRDGHSRLDQLALPNHGRPALQPLPWPGFDTAYPIDLEVFADGLWVVGATAAHADLTGAHVVAIDGRPVADAVAALAPFIPSDNAMWTLRALPTYLACPGYLAAAGLASSTSALLRLTLASAKGAKRDATIAAAKPDSSAQWLAADRDVRAPLPLTRRLPYPFAFVDLDDSTVYARIQAIVSEQGHEGLPAFTARLFAHMDSLGTPRLVLDLRGNGGGNGYLNQPLVHAVLRRPALDRTGRLFVITDRGTFSAATQLTADLERETHAVFVGEPTGAAPDSPGDPAKVRLPASGIVVRISSVQWNGSDPRDPRAFIAPDVPARPTFADWMAHRDPAIDAIAKYRVPADLRDVPPNQHWGSRAKIEAVAPSIAW